MEARITEQAPITIDSEESDKENNNKQKELGAENNYGCPIAGPSNIEKEAESSHSCTINSLDTANLNDIKLTAGLPKRKFRRKGRKRIPPVKECK